jgi:hypothetical protein
MEHRPRTWDTGLVRPYRPAPEDFRDVFLRLGQSKDIEEHYRTNWRVIIRWIDECGGEQLRQDRAAITGNVMHPDRRRAKRYVLGRTLTAVKQPQDKA